MLCEILGYLNSLFLAVAILVWRFGILIFTAKCAWCLFIHVLEIFGWLDIPLFRYHGRGVLLFLGWHLDLYVWGLQNGRWYSAVFSFYFAVILEQHFEGHCTLQRSLGQVSMLHLWRLMSQPKANALLGAGAEGSRQACNRTIANIADVNRWVMTFVFFDIFENIFKINRIDIGL